MQKRCNHFLHLLWAIYSLLLFTVSIDPEMLIAQLVHSMTLAEEVMNVELVNHDTRTVCYIDITAELTNSMNLLNPQTMLKLGL